MTMNTQTGKTMFSPMDLMSSGVIREVGRFTRRVAVSPYLTVGSFGVGPSNAAGDAPVVIVQLAVVDGAGLEGGWAEHAEGSEESNTASLAARQTNTLAGLHQAIPRLDLFALVLA
jgi:hypothetical protein